MTWTHCEVYWDLDFEPSETSGGHPVALEGIRCLASSFGMEPCERKNFHLQFWDGTLCRDFSPAGLGWRLLN